MDFRVPELGEGVYEAELVAWLVKPGDPVKRGQGLMEVMTDKASMEVPAPFAGIITGLATDPGKQIKVGDVILSYTPAGQEDDGAAHPRAEAPAEVVSANGGQPPAEPLAIATPPRLRLAMTPPSVKASPSVRQLARKLGIDLTRLRGTGPQGRILIDDIASHIPAASSADKKPAEPRPDFGTPGTRVKLIGLRRTIAEHMVMSKRTVPHYTYIDECDVTELVRLREMFKEPYARIGVKLTYLAFIVKAVAETLKDVPIANASLDEAAGEIVLHDRYDIGIAVAAPAGLVVPVVRDAARKDIAQLARDIDRLSSEARTGKAKREDLKGGTFTVTSVGNIGGLISTPVINHPEVGILGVGKVGKRPVYDAAGHIKPAEIMYLSLSFDHRVVDGAVGAAFGNGVIRRLQAPAAMLVATGH